MTTNEKNRRLAELLGWTEHRTKISKNYDAVCWTPPGWDGAMSQVLLTPLDYCGDLNAVHEVELSQLDTYKLKLKYSNLLAKVVGSNLWDGGGCHAHLWISASAEARVDALIQTLSQGEA